MTTTTRKTVSLDSDVAEAAIGQARADSRTLSNYINKLLRERFEAAAKAATPRRGRKQAA